jgi:hypothetical protein
VPDEPGVQRLVPGAAAGDQGDLARPWRVGPVDDPVADPQRRVRGGEAGQRVLDHRVGRVDELLHGRNICPF